MVTKVTLETKKFELWHKRVLRHYRLAIFKALAANIDSIRNDAPKNIIPSTTNKMWSPYRMRKFQPSTPGRITERKGYLIEMLKSKGKWDFSSSTYKSGRFSYTAAKKATLSTHSLKGLIKVVSGANTDSERYVATLAADIRGDNPFIGKRISAARRIDGMLVSNLETAQKLAMRFKWETGIRGSRRPFVEQSIQRENINITSIIQSRIATIGLGR
jgi:hypothetical protein